jgi:hypothetical protein
MPDLRRERDEELARTIAQQAGDRSTSYRSWTEEEIQEQLMRASVLESASDHAERLDKVAELKVRLKEIRDNEIDSAAKSIEGKVDEIYQGVFDDAADAREYLEEGLCRFESIQRELLKLRVWLDELWEPLAEEDADGDNDD